ncbi:hypothetical protein ROSEINA2194_00734 [Roseburia inulinivorans DSM 16841]|uniref:Uncharacterized protein n=1 Tax=Roseburia inulinivorans DSM 16841 TaxID=622312 RepID=C0FPT1_9FIRM|nr:hypothetical protein ROSEINA2194_00734 [Roseburia inulinivorans DSM 16841]
MIVRVTAFSKMVVCSDSLERRMRSATKPNTKKCQSKKNDRTQ